MIAFAPAAAANGYIVAELPGAPPPGLPVASAAKLNNAGSAAGEAVVAAETRHAVRWDHGTFNDLGTLPGETESSAGAINDNNVTVGSSYTNSTGTRRATKWNSAGQPTELPHLPGMSKSVAKSVGNNGVAVGISSDDDGYFAVRWDTAGAPSALPALAPGKLTTATDISADGSVIVGSSGWGTGDDYHPVVWSGGAVTDLGLLSGYRSAGATATNGNGVVVGEAADDDYPLLNIPVRWTNGQIQQLSLPCLTSRQKALKRRGTTRPASLLGPPGRRPSNLSPTTVAALMSRQSGDTLCAGMTTDVNQAGDATGIILAEDANGNSTWDAVLWRADGTLVYLPAPVSGVTANANGINDGNVIVGAQGTDSGGRAPALRWSE